MDNKNFLKGSLIIAAAATTTLALIPKVNAVEIEKNANEVSLSYLAHMQTYGWGDNKYVEAVNTPEQSNNPLENPETFAGKTGESKRMEALKIDFKGPEGSKLKCRTHIQSIGWSENWEEITSADQEIGLSGQSKRLEAIQLSLEGADEYILQYRVHMQGIGWGNWITALNGTEGVTTEVDENNVGTNFAGTMNSSKRIEAIEIAVVKDLRVVAQKQFTSDIESNTNLNKKLEGVDKSILETEEVTAVIEQAKSTILSAENSEEAVATAVTDANNSVLEAVKKAVKSYIDILAQEEGTKNEYGVELYLTKFDAKEGKEAVEEATTIDDIMAVYNDVLDKRLQKEQYDRETIGSEAKLQLEEKYKEEDYTAHHADYLNALNSEEKRIDGLVANKAKYEDTTTLQAGVQKVVTKTKAFANIHTDAQEYGENGEKGELQKKIEQVEQSEENAWKAVLDKEIEATLTAGGTNTILEKPTVKSLLEKRGTIETIKAELQNACDEKIENFNCGCINNQGTARTPENYDGNDVSYQINDWLRTEIIAILTEVLEDNWSIGEFHANEVGETLIMDRNAYETAKNSLNPTNLSNSIEKVNDALKSGKTKENLMKGFFNDNLKTYYQDTWVGEGFYFKGDKDDTSQKYAKLNKYLTFNMIEKNNTGLTISPDNAQKSLATCDEMLTCLFKYITPTANVGMLTECNSWDEIDSVAEKMTEDLRNTLKNVLTTVIDKAVADSELQQFTETEGNSLKIELNKATTIIEMLSAMTKGETE